MGKVYLIASQFYRFYFCRQLLRILYRFRNIGKEGFHLLLRFKIEFIVRETETFPAASADRRRDRLIVVDTEKCIVRLCIFFIYVERVVGSDHLDVVLFRKPEQYGVHPLLFFKAMTHQFEDRKSTRLNSSHVAISYAVFCLKKKT